MAAAGTKAFFAGPAATKKLFHLGIYTIGDLAKTEPELLKYHLKKQGEILWAYANGIDTSAVQLKPPAAKGFGNSTTIAFDVCDASTAKRVLLSLAETVGARLRAADVKAGVVAVAIKTFDLHCARHQMTLENATDITEEITAAPAGYSTNCGTGRQSGIWAFIPAV